LNKAAYGGGIPGRKRASDCSVPGTTSELS
jgi:hypothetical protein